MSSRVFLEQEPDGTCEWLHFDDDGNPLGIERVNDVESVIDDNKRAQNDGTRGYGKTRELQHVASIPPNLFLKWANEKGVPADFLWTREGFKEITLRMIRDPDYRWLRRDI